MGGLSLTTAAFIFQACYGTMQDMERDIHIYGVVKSARTGIPIKGIRVAVITIPQSVYSSDDGTFSLYTERSSSCNLRFDDIDAEINGKYEARDTTLSITEGEVRLEILLKEK